MFAPVGVLFALNVALKRLANGNEPFGLTGDAGGIFKLNREHRSCFQRFNVVTGTR